MGWLGHDNDGVPPGGGGTPPDPFTVNVQNGIDLVTWNGLVHAQVAGASVPVELALAMGDGTGVFSVSVGGHVLLLDQADGLLFDGSPIAATDFSSLAEFVVGAAAQIALTAGTDITLDATDDVAVTAGGDASLAAAGLLDLSSGVLGVHIEADGDAAVVRFRTVNDLAVTTNELRLDGDDGSIRLLAGAIVELAGDGGSVTIDGTGIHFAVAGHSLGFSAAAGLVVDGLAFGPDSAAGVVLRFTDFGTFSDTEPRTTTTDGIITAVGTPEPMRFHGSPGLFRLNNGRAYFHEEHSWIPNDGPTAGGIDRTVSIWIAEKSNGDNDSDPSGASYELNDFEGPWGIIGTGPDEWSGWCHVADIDIPGTATTAAECTIHDRRRFV